MFVNCPFCRALVATDPATDLPPERCPRCAAQLRDIPGVQSAAAVDNTRSGVATAITGVFDEQSVAQEDLAAQPALSIATLLQVEPGPEPASQPEPASETALDPKSELDSGSNLAAKPEPESGRDATTGSAGTLAPPAAGADAAAAAPSTAPLARPPRAPGRLAPSFARRRPGIPSDHVTGRRWLMPTAIVGLSLLLALQWLLADRARLAADPGWRPLVARACAVLQCSLPPWREPSAFVLLERDVRPHPDAANALRITASFRNDAAWAQPWPDVVLTLSDIDGHPLGTRAFTAAEYLDGAPPSDLLDSGQGAVIRMDVLEPGPGAVGFAFAFD